MKTWQTIVKENDLDVSVINLEDLEATFRIDAEYYSLRFLENNKKITQKNHFFLSDSNFVKQITDGDHGNPEYASEGVPYLKLEQFGIVGLDFSNPVFVSASYTNKQGEKNYTKQGDVLISMKGTLGKIGLVIGDEVAILNRDIAVVRTLEGTLLPEYLYLYLSSYNGQSIIEQFGSGGLQKGLYLGLIKKIVVPVASFDFQKKLAGLVRDAHFLQQSSVACYREAEQLLLKEINLEGYVPSKENTSVRELTECLADNRFDAEYWEPRFDEILDRIKNYKGGASIISDEFSQIKNGFKPDPETMYRYVEIGDINVSTGEASFTELEGKELPANAKITLGEKQLVTSKVRPNRGATAILNNHKGYIASGAFVVLKETGRVTLETLQVYLKSPFIRDLLLRYNTGTAYPTIVDTDILNLPLPLVDKGVQEAITEKIKQCSKERTEARKLLEKAKRAVEIFIEKDEQEALKYLAP